MARPIPSNVRCPTCSSAAVERITGGKKVAWAATVGIFGAKTIMSTFKCQTCGQKF